MKTNSHKMILPKRLHHRIQDKRENKNKWNKYTYGKLCGSLDKSKKKILIIHKMLIKMHSFP